MPFPDKALWIIERNLTQPLTLDGIAAACGVSRSPLAHAFGTATGVSVMQYVRASNCLPDPEKGSRDRFRAGKLAEKSRTPTPGIPSAKRARLAKPVKEGPMQRREPRYPLTSRPRTR